MSNTSSTNPQSTKSHDPVRLAAASSPVVHEMLETRLLLAATPAQFGRFTAGDFNGDTRADLVIAALRPARTPRRRRGQRAGPAARQRRGWRGRCLPGAQAIAGLPAEVGTAVSSGDVNGDGRLDLIAGGRRRGAGGGRQRGRAVRDARQRRRHVRRPDERDPRRRRRQHVRRRRVQRRRPGRRSDRRQPRRTTLPTFGARPPRRPRRLHRRLHRRRRRPPHRRRRLHRRRHRRPRRPWSRRRNRRRQHRRRQQRRFRRR